MCDAKKILARQRAHAVGGRGTCRIRRRLEALGIAVCRDALVILELGGAAVVGHGGVDRAGLGAVQFEFLRHYTIDIISNWPIGEFLRVRKTSTRADRDRAIDDATPAAGRGDAPTA